MQLQYLQSAERKCECCRPGTQVCRDEEVGSCSICSLQMKKEVYAGVEPTLQSDEEVAGLVPRSAGAC